jgi:hypothetical protein
MENVKLNKKSEEAQRASGGSAVTVSRPHPNLLQHKRLSIAVNIAPMIPLQLAMALESVLYSLVH